MESKLSDSDEADLVAIGLQMQQGKEVDFPDQLRYLSWREKIVASHIKDDLDAYAEHEVLLAQIETVRQKIMNLGVRGGNMTGEASLRDSHNNPR